MIILWIVIMDTTLLMDTYKCNVSYNNQTMSMDIYNGHLYM